MQQTETAKLIGGRQYGSAAAGWLCQRPGEGCRFHGIFLRADHVQMESSEGVKMLEKQRGRAGGVIT